MVVAKDNSRRSFMLYFLKIAVLNYSDIGRMVILYMI
nr:MAG TPA: hypothetical protein [Caudoviricetes sp.]